MHKFTDDELKDALANNNNSTLYASRALNVSEEAVRKRRLKLVAQGWSPEHDLVHTVPDGYRISGVSTYYNEDGKPKGQWVKSKVDSTSEKLDILKDGLKGFTDELPKYPAITIYNEHQLIDDYMAVLPIGDLHVGMMAWKDESGNDWSLKHVETAFQLAMADVISKCPSCGTGVLINLGDFAHRDGRYALTPNSGHQLDVDSRYPKMIRVGIRLMRFLIDLMLTKFGKVDVKNVAGNHDPCFSVFLGECLKIAYENEPRVTIDITPTPMHYYEFGKVMIATTHGDTIRMDRMAGVAATDESEMWGRTKHRYGLTGHIHSQNKMTAKEFPGMVVESFRTIAAPDSFAAWYGWRSGRDTRAIIYHKEHGKHCEMVTPVTMFQEILDDIE